MGRRPALGIAPRPASHRDFLAGAMHNAARLAVNPATHHRVVRASRAAIEVSQFSFGRFGGQWGSHRSSAAAAGRVAIRGSITGLAVATEDGGIMAAAEGSRASIAVLPVPSANRVAGVWRRVVMARLAGQPTRFFSGARPTATRGEAGVTTGARAPPPPPRRPEGDKKPSSDRSVEAPVPILQARAGTASRVDVAVVVDVAVLAVLVDLVSGDDLAAAATGAERRAPTRHRNLPGGQVAISAGRQGGPPGPGRGTPPGAVSPPTSRNGWIG